MYFRSIIQTALITSLALTASLATAATPEAFFQSATITSAGNRIAVSRVPVQDAAGNITYKNVVLDFTVDAAGVLALADASPVITPAPTLITSAFKAGNYKDQIGNRYVLSGPSAIPNSTRTAWSLNLVKSTQATQFSMTWATGPIKGHPNESSIVARKITSTAYSWGIGGAQTVSNSNFPFFNWGNDVIGASQVGNQLAFYLYRAGDNIVDESVSLTLCATTC